MLEAEVTVAVTREGQHQSVLARYPVPDGQERRVAVELGWCRIASGKYRGDRAVEVRLDGARAGELTYAMSQRYSPLVSQVTAYGGRPGCTAVIARGTKGLEITLRLPRNVTSIPVPRVLPPLGAPGAPAFAHPRPTQLPPMGTGTHVMPVLPAQPPRRVASHRPWWIAAAVVAVLFIAAIATNSDEPTTTAADRTPITTAPTTAAPTTTTVAPAPPPVQTTVAAPPPVTLPPAAPPPAAKPQPEPEPQCDPNYSGCVPVASDVDCAGGSGNGPAYVKGPIRVIGTDIYGLDRNNDGVACE